MTSGFIEVKPIKSSYKIMINIDQIVFIREGRMEMHNSSIVKEWCEIHMIDDEKYDSIKCVEESYNEVKKLINDTINRTH